MSAGVGLDIGPLEPDALTLDVAGRQLPGIDRLVHAPGIHTEDRRGLPDPYQITLAAHTTSMYVIQGG